MNVRSALASTTLTALVLASLCSTGCEDRRNMRTTPDRGGHAYRVDGTREPLSNGPAVPNDNEQVYTVKATDTMKSVCKQFGVDEAWLIKRNALTKEEPFKTGMNLIVPKTKPAGK